MLSFPKNAIKSLMPEWIPPTLAILTHDYFDDPNWFYEEKFDGVRAIAFFTNNKVQLFSRNHKLLNATYPEIIEAIASLSQKNFIIDGEIVVYKDNKTSFSLLQQRIQLNKAEDIRKTGIKVDYCAFDLLYYDQYNLTNVELFQRKILLKELFNFKDPLHFTLYVTDNGLVFFREACKKGWEGVVVKRANSIYPAKRTTDWLKFKCINQQEFVIIGYTTPQGQRIGLGALLVGYYKESKLHYAGKVGTGYNFKLLEDLKNRLTSIHDIKPGLLLNAEKVNESNICWVKPELVCEVSFTEWTKKGLLRHPSFLGLRFDKDPKEVIREI